MYEIVLREPMLPAVIEPVTIKRPWWLSQRVQVVRLENVMVVYKVVPHANVKADTKSLWRSLYKMYDMYAKPMSRLERDGLKFTYREKDSFWFDIVFKQVDGKRKVEFYVGTTDFQAEKLKRRLENMMHVTLKDAQLVDLEIPEENTVVQELRYARHDIFSLSTKVTERHTPIGSILNTVDELEHDGDVARLSVSFEHEERKRWASNAARAKEKLKSGKVPQRFGTRQVIPIARNGLAGLVNGLNTLMQETFEAVHNAFFTSSQKVERHDIFDRNQLLDELNSSKVSDQTKMKPNLPVLKTRIRVATHSKSRLTRDTLAETLSSGVTDTNHDNELQASTVRGKAAKRAIKEMNTLKMERQTRMDPNVNLISTDEMSKLALQFPDRPMQMRYADELDAKYRVEVEVPAALRTGRGIPLGTAAVKNRTIEVDMPTDNPKMLYRSVVFAGSAGVGKDTATKNLIINACLKHGISSVVIDAIEEEGEDGLANGIRDALPPDRFVDLDLGNDDYIVPLDLTEVITSLGRLGPSRFADELTDFIDLTGHSTSKRYLQDAAKASGGSLYNIKRIIEDEKFRGETIKRLKEEGDNSLANDLESWGTNKDIGRKADAVLDRLYTFFGNDRLRDVFRQDPLPDVDFARWMKEGKVIILRVPNRKLGKLATQTLVHWITLKTYMTRLLMKKMDQKQGCFVVFNEPEQYMTPGLSEIMGRICTEGRKERISGIFCFHHWNKLPKELQENLAGGGCQEFLFANDHHQTFKQSAHRFIDTIPMEQAERLPHHHAIVSLRTAESLQPAFICKMHPPTKARYNNSHVTAVHAKRYGRHWKDLQQQQEVAK